MSTVAKPVVPQHPSADKRYKMLDATIKRHQAQPDSLLEVLHNAQELFGYLEDSLLVYVGRSLKVPLSRVYGVATFYNFFSLKPKGEHTCVVCMGTACYVKGAGEIVTKVEQEFGIQVGETTNDNKVSLMTARCVGSCGLAPAVVFDGNVEGHVSSRAAVERLKGWTHE
jgi:bidirectional [NiFe] hydrogenase diaphorase subunit